MRFSACVVALGLALGAVVAFPGTAVAAGPDTGLVSVSSSGGPADAPSDRPQISGDGRWVTFDSQATNLVPGTSTKVRRVYARDLQTGATQAVSVDRSDKPSDAWSSFSWPSDDGGLVAFTSDATDLVEPATVRRGVFVRDLTAGVTELVSVSSNGTRANRAASRPMITGSGRYVGFSSAATNLDPRATSGIEQTYVRDRLLGTTTLISVTSGGGSGNATSYRAMVSQDGRFVAFSSRANNILPGDTNGAEDVFLRDVSLGTTTRISVASDGAQVSRGGNRPYLTPDGRFIAFNTYAALLPADTNGKSDVYVYDRSTGSPTRASVAADGGNGSGDSLRGFLSDNGRYVFFNSFSNNLVASDANGGRGDVFVRDLVDNATTLLSQSWYGGGSDDNSFRPVPSGDGGTVTYLSRASNLVQGDQSQSYQVYAVHRSSVAPGGDTTAPTVSVTAPGNGDTVSSPTRLSGTAADNVAIERVYIGLRKNDDMTWLQPDSTWATTFARLSASLAAPYAATTDWSFDVSLPAGTYGFSTTAFDTAGNEVASKPWTRFTVATP